MDHLMDPTVQKHIESYMLFPKSQAQERVLLPFWFYPTKQLQIQNHNAAGGDSLLFLSSAFLFPRVLSFVSFN
jgi:hypothetical protein